MKPKKIGMYEVQAMIEVGIYEITMMMTAVLLLLFYEPTREILYVFSPFLNTNMWGPTLLILFVFLCEITKNKKSTRVCEGIRPFVKGILLANIFCMCEWRLILITLSVIGIMLVTDRAHVSSSADVAKLTCVTIVGMEIYSILYYIKGDFQIFHGYSDAKSFLLSVWVDLAFVIMCLFFFVGRQKLIDRVRNSKSYRWITCYSRKLKIITGSVMLICAVVVLLVNCSAVVIGKERIANDRDNVYIMHCSEDPSLVLTALEVDDAGNCRLALTRYTGAKNQKVEIEQVSDELAFFRPLNSKRALGCSVRVDDAFVLLYNPNCQDELEVSPNLVSQGYPISYAWPAEIGENPEIVVGCFVGENAHFFPETTCKSQYLSSMVEEDGKGFKVTTLIARVYHSLGKGSYLLGVVFVALTFLNVIYTRKILYPVILLYAIFFGATTTLFFTILAWSIDTVVQKHR